MELKITKQINENECGACVLTSLHNYYYNDSLSKTEVLDRSNISDTGMTIFDLENCAKYVGLELESYEVSYNEFCNLKIGKYFILLLSSNDMNHYVIAKKDKKGILIYDSNYSKPRQISSKELEKLFLNVLILVHKKSNPLFKKIFSEINSLLMFDLKFVLLNILLSCVILTLSILSATYLNYVIDMAIGQGSLTNLITISFIYLFSFISNEILTYISSLYSAKHLKSYMQLFTSNILEKLKNKDMHFLDKVDKNWIFKIDECVYSISSFTIVEINKFITNTIFCVVCICVIGTIQYWLLLFVLAITIIEFIFFLFSYRKRKTIMLSIVKTENKNLWIYKQLIESISFEIWPRKRNELINQVKSNYSDIYKNYSNALIFKENTSLIKGILKNILEIASIICMSYFVIKNTNFSIGKLIFCLTTLNFYKNSSSDFFHYFLAKFEFEIYWDVYKDLTFVGNFNPSNEAINRDVKSLVITKGEHKLRLLKNKNNVIPISLIEVLKNSDSIKLNDTNLVIKNNQLIVIDEFSSFCKELLIKDIQLDPKLYSDFLRYFNIDINNSRLTVYQKTIVNLLSILSEKNQLIIMDDIYKYMPSKDKIMFNKLILNIQNNNHVFFVRKEEND